MGGSISFVTTAVAALIVLVVLFPPTRRLLRRLLRRLYRRGSRRYVLLPAHACSEDERRAALALVGDEFGAGAHGEVAAAMRTMCRDGSGGSCRGVPVVWLAVTAASPRVVVGHGLWQSAVLKSARPGGAAVKNYIARMVARGIANKAAIRKCGKLHGLSLAQVETLLPKKSWTMTTTTSAPVNTTPARYDPEYARFFKMIKCGIPLGAVKQSVKTAGLHPDTMDRPDAPAPVTPDLTPDLTQRRSDIPKVKTSDIWTHQSNSVVLSRLVVDADHRGQGLGKALTLVGAAHCAELGASRVLGMARSKELIAWYTGMGAVASMEQQQEEQEEVHARDKPAATRRQIMEQIRANVENTASKYGEGGGEEFNSRTARIIADSWRVRAEWTSRQLQADPVDHGCDTLEAARAKVQKMCGAVAVVWPFRGGGEKEKEEGRRNLNSPTTQQI